MNLILFSVTTFAVLDYFYRFMRFVSTDLAKIAKFLCFYSKSGLWVNQWVKPNVFKIKSSETVVIKRSQSFLKITYQISCGYGPLLLCRVLYQSDRKS